MNKFGFLTLLLISVLWGSPKAAAYTVKTNHTDVNLWSEAGRETGETIGKIERFEEVEVLGKKTLSSGQNWFKVKLRRSPGWRKHDQTGWVDSQFFAAINRLSEEDQPQEADALATCKHCLEAAKRKSGKNVEVLSELAQRALGRRSRQGFIWPAVGVIRSGFGMRRHPITQVVKLHNGIDIAGNNGKPVLAAKAGRVVASSSGCVTGAKWCHGGAGNMIIIDHGDGTQTKYLHLNPGCRLASAGAFVAQGERIACVGQTGAATGPHLHFSVVLNGHYINPLTVLAARD